MMVDIAPANSTDASFMDLALQGDPFAVYTEMHGFCPCMGWLRHVR